MGETLTTGCYSPGGMNFAIGTSYGAVYFGHLKADPLTTGVRNKYLNCKVARLEGLSKTVENAVTSIALTDFTPSGRLLVAFDDGCVRVW
jgi:hypothetical protein